MTTESQSPLATALGIVLEEDNAKSDREKKRAVAALQTDEDRANTDATFAREILYDTEVKTSEAIDQLMNIAGESMSARHFEVLAQLLANRAVNAERFLKIAADKQKVQNNAINLERNKAQGNSQQPTAINATGNIVFVGSTTDLLQVIRKEQLGKVIDITPDKD